jgi:hypothetical protein
MPYQAPYVVSVGSRSSAEEGEEVRVPLVSVLKIPFAKCEAQGDRRIGDTNLASQAAPSLPLRSLAETATQVR